MFKPIELRLEVEPARARLVAAGVVGDVDVDDAVEMAARHGLRVFVHDHGMVEVVGDADFWAVDRIDNGERFLRAGEIIAGVIDPVIERLETASSLLGGDVGDGMGEMLRGGNEEKLLQDLISAIAGAAEADPLLAFGGEEL